MTEWKIAKERTADGDFWIYAEVEVPYYTLAERKPLTQRFCLYWTGAQWVDHAQYDRRKRFSGHEVDQQCAHPMPQARLSEYLENFFGPHGGPP